MKKKALKNLIVFSAAITLLFSSITVSAAETTYTTKSGDSLSKIAKEMYGDARKWRDIYESNKNQIKNPNIIHANQILVIPDLGSEITSTTTETSVVTENQATTTETQTTTETTETDVIKTDVTETENQNAAETVTAAAATYNDSAFMKTIYSLMSAKAYTMEGDYYYNNHIINDMTDLAWSDELTAFLASMTSDGVYYIPDGNSTGVGVGAYKCDTSFGNAEKIYYYYGNYVNGVRAGNGVTYAFPVGVGDTDYMLFEGVWSNDAPNGYGEYSIIRYDNSETYVTARGNLVNGLWNGNVNYLYMYNWNNVTLDLSYTAVNGIPVQDKTAEFYTAMGYAIRDDIGDYKVYAYDIGPESYLSRAHLDQPGDAHGIIGFTNVTGWDNDIYYGFSNW